MSEITHFIHKHPLVLRKQFPEPNVHRFGNLCYLCDPLNVWEVEKEGDVYVCELCENFFLHKSCAQLPREIIHKSHERHPLILSQKVLSSNRCMSCDLCSTYIANDVCYKCDLCKFRLHIRCVSGKKENVIDYDDKSIISLNHPSHKTHSLTLLSRPAAVLCDACDHKHEDFFYHCLSCRYQIHRRCALLPSTHNWEGHPDHPLHLLFTIPSEYHDFVNLYCELCGERILKNPNWVYYCTFCKYFAHVKCMAAKIEINTTRMPTYNVRLPTATADITEDLIKPIFFGDKEPVDIKEEIQIFSHKQHPLVLCHDKITEDVIEDDEELLCDGCIRPILEPPYYRCAQCRYFLHHTCANLPRELAFSLLPGRPIVQDFPKLTLGSKSRFYEDFTCSMCDNPSNGFYYWFEDDGKQCLHVKCVPLLYTAILNVSYTYKHESHGHPLVQEHCSAKIKKDKCKGCSGSTKGRFTFSCLSCQFDLHYDCIMLPKSTRHRFDSEHPLFLEFPPHDYHEDPFDCAECEKKIDRGVWLYHCRECDLSFHTSCINDTLGKYKFGQKLQISTHPQHPLRFVSKAAVKGICKLCPKDIHDNLAFECQICNYHVCRSCAKFEHMS